MRVSRGELRIESHLGQQFPRAPRGPPAGHDPVRDQRFGDRRADAHPRIEAVVGILEHDLGRAPVILQRAPAQRCDVLSFKTDLPAGRCHQPDHCPPDRGLAGAALANQPEAERAGGEPQAHPVDRPDRAEPDRQVGDLEQRRRRPGRVRGLERDREGGAVRLWRRPGGGSLRRGAHRGRGAGRLGGRRPGAVLRPGGHGRGGVLRFGGRRAAAALRPGRHGPAGSLRRRHWPAPAARRGTDASSSAA